MKSIIIVALVTAFVALGLIWLVVHANGKDARDRTRHEQECLARGGTLRLNRWNEYDGCWINLRQGG